MFSPKVGLYGHVCRSSLAGPLRSISAAKAIGPTKSDGCPGKAKNAFRILPAMIDGQLPLPLLCGERMRRFVRGQTGLRWFSDQTGSDAAFCA